MDRQLFSPRTTPCRRDIVVSTRLACAKLHIPPPNPLRTYCRLTTRNDGRAGFSAYGINMNERSNQVVSLNFRFIDRPTSRIMQTNFQCAPFRPPQKHRKATFCSDLRNCSPTWPRTRVARVFPSDHQVTAALLHRPCIGPFLGRIS